MFVCLSHSHLQNSSDEKGKFERELSQWRLLGSLVPWFGNTDVWTHVKLSTYLSIASSESGNAHIEHSSTHNNAYFDSMMDR